MADREIRIRGADTESLRAEMVRLIAEYERIHMNDGRGLGARNCVVWHWKSGAAACVYHTKAAIIGIYQEAPHVG